MPSHDLLLIKTSSLGDIVHNLPVASDIRRAFPDARIDWLVEEGFAAIPRLHPALHAVIPVAWRRWRKTLWAADTRREIREFAQKLRARRYDLVLDSQGLLKSALLARLAHGPRAGFAAASAREALAALFYQRRFVVTRAQHAVQRNRQLAASAFGYALDAHCDYGLAPAARAAVASDYWMLLHMSSRPHKLWPEAQWIALARQLAARGLRAVIPAGNEIERTRGERLAAACNGELLPPSSLEKLAELCAGAALAVGVDTGLTHLAAATGIPALGIFVATDPNRTGVFAPGTAINLGGAGAAPSVDEVMAHLNNLLEGRVR
jgi:heptosyltransferase-1